MAAFFDTMGRRTQLVPNQMPELLRTHPVTSTRIAEARDRAAQQPPVTPRPSMGYALAKERVRVLSTPAGTDPRAYYTAVIANEPDASTAQVYGLALAQMTMGDATAAILSRADGYMGVMIDDLVTKGTLEPYRMFTSRAEHRLLLREDNADERLTAIGRDLGLVDDSRWSRHTRKQAAVNEIMAGLEAIRIRPDIATKNTVEAMGGTIPQKAVSLKELLRQPELTIDMLTPLWPGLENFDGEALEEAEIKTKYEGYLRRQQELVDRFEKMEQTTLPEDMNYTGIPGLSREVTEKLTRIQPRTLGQAGRISGITPAALSCLEIQLKKIGRL